MHSTREIIITKDGSHSLLHKQLNETYHSVHGAIQESQYVFIEQGLRHWWNMNHFETARILEIGFGTGLNALLTLQESIRQQVRVEYATIEAFPIGKEVWEWLNYTDTLGDAQLFSQLHEVPWETEQNISPSFLFKKYYNTLQDIILLPNSFDVIYFDAFAPSKQPDMWTVNILSKVVGAMSEGGLFVTYCAKGQLKRDLKAMLLDVETLPGPPGKKEMVRGSKAHIMEL